MSFILLLTLFSSTARATISEPDNVLYGSISISNQPVTAARTDVVIEAQRVPGGPPIASYRMGTDPSLGSFYSLNLKTESVGALSATNASSPGQSVFIVLKDAGGTIGQTLYTLPERGHVRRVDFGATLDDVDGNGLPDLWELAFLGSAGNDPDALTPNGRSAMRNYIAGTNPNDPEDTFKLKIDRTGSLVEVSFLARKSAGPGYDGKRRFYALESRSTNGGSWSAVPGYTDVEGADQTVSYTPSASTAMALYRGKVSLMLIQTPGAPRLTIRLSGPNVVLSWPSSAAGFTLQDNGSLNPAGWTDVSMPPSDDGTNNSITVPTAAGTRLYRLRN